MTSCWILTFIPILIFILIFILFVFPPHRSIMVRVTLPFHLRTLARISGEVQLEVQGPVTQKNILDALEARFPMLCGTIRDHTTHVRRPFLRFFVCGQDISNQAADVPLPAPIASGQEPFLIIGALAGG